MSVLSKSIVLVLNRNWQAIDIKTVEAAFIAMAKNACTALDISGENMSPVKWEDWFNLPVREEDNFIRTVHGSVRVPTVVVLCRYDRMPKRKPNFSARGIWERDNNTCQYTGKKLARGEGNIDHLIPKSRGGHTTWENCVLADKHLNSVKGSKTPDEAGLKLLRKPKSPKEVPASFFIRNTHNIPDWDIFLKFNEGFESA